MSSTRVKDRRGTHLDFYETPERVTRSLLGSLPNVDLRLPVLEPSAGRGAIVRAFKAVYPGMHVTGVEIQPSFEPDLEATCDEVRIADFLHLDLPAHFGLVIANPPFSQAHEFVERAVGLLAGNGRAAFLLRLPFVAGVKRYSLFRAHPPLEVMVLSQRPKFGGSNIDSCDYAWIVWGARPAASTRMSWLAPVTA